MEAAALGDVDGRLLEPRAHGFDYGVVGLLELADPPVAGGYVLAAACKTFWLRDQGEANELEAKLGLFGDTVPDAIPLKVDSQLFVESESTPSASNGELDLKGAPPPSAVPPPVNDTGVGLVLATLENLAGATSMTRHRCLGCSLGVEVLAELLTPYPTQDHRHGVAASFAMGVMAGLLRSVVKEAHTSNDELFVIAEAAELISGMSLRDGMEPIAFSRLLLERVAGVGGDGAAAIASKLCETIAKLADNQLELTTSRIDDSGQIGLRSLMVFLLAPSPDQALRWISARKDIGFGVSILTSMFSGLYAGLGSVPRQVKAPDKSVFLATTAYAQALLDGRPTPTLYHRWAEDGVEHHALVAGGHQLAAVENSPTPQIALLLNASRSAGLIGRVHPETGAITVGRSGGNVASPALATVGKSRWLEVGPVVVLSCDVRQPGKGQCPRYLLERLLAPGLAPVWAALGEGPGQVVLSIEVLLQDSEFAHRLNDALTALYSTAEDLALCFPMEPLGRRRGPSKKFNVPKVDAGGSVGASGEL
jgi:hypothetical protein